MIVLLAGLILLAADAPQITVCNAMKVDVSGISLDDVAVSKAGAVLHPGDCLTVQAPPPGEHTLRFVESGRGSAALCARKVTLAPGQTVSIAPNDGASCML